MNKPNRIGIDARFYGAAGPGRYAKNIISHLEKIDPINEYVIFLKKDNFDLYTSQNPNFKKVLADYKWYSWSEQIGFLFCILKQRLDLFYMPHFNFPILYPKKIVSAIPDIILFFYSTEEGATISKLYYKIKMLVSKFVVAWALIRSKKVIVPSKDTLSDFIKVFPYISRDKYVLAYEGIDPVLKSASASDNSDLILDKYGLNKPYLLYVSSMYRHKNVYKLVEAFEVLVKEQGFDGQLVLIGKKDKFSQMVYDFVSSKGLQSRILLPGLKGFVPDEDVVALRKKAIAYVFPSLKEGFSLTPLEAQVLGLPCAISDIPCHKEMYDDSVLYFDPLNVNDIVEKLNEIITNVDLRKNLIEKGFQQSKKYDWNTTAQLTLGVFNDILK